MVTMVDDRDMGHALGAADYLPSRSTGRSSWRVLSAATVASGRPGHLLIVEDDATTRELMRRTLEQDGWTRLRRRRTGGAALRCLADAEPELILLDLMMPEMDGFEFLTDLRQSEEGRRVPVVVVTAKAVTAADRARLNGQVARIFNKGSFTRAELIAELRRVLVTGRRAEPQGPRS